jgi:hypothetical protein
MQGYKYTYCTACGQTVSEEYSEKLPHKLTDWIVDKEPTCTDIGHKYKYCTVCKANVEKAGIPTVDHKAIWFVDADATCDKDGIKHSECTICGKTLEITTIDRLPHTESGWVVTKSATCSETGSQQIECKTCGTVIRTESIEKTAHSYDKEGICKNCGFRKDHNCKYDGHVYGNNWVMDVEPTCTSKGSKSHHCIYCDVKKDVTVIGKLAHTYASARIEPTCLKNGYTVYVCLCGDTYYETIPVAEHKFDGSECVNCGLNKADNCACNCHKTGIIKIIFRIVLIFQRFFGANKHCACGEAHY